MGMENQLQAGLKDITSPSTDHHERGNENAVGLNFEVQRLRPKCRPFQAVSPKTRQMEISNPRGLDNCAHDM